MFFGERRPYGALLTYWVSDANDSDATATISIRDSGGRLVSTFESDADGGMNRTSWDLTMQGDSARLRGEEGLEVLAGTYMVSVDLNGVSSVKSLEVRAAQDDPWSLEDRTANLAARRTVQLWIAVGEDARDRLAHAVTALDQILDRLDADNDGDLTAEGQRLRDELSLLNEELFVGPTCQGSCGVTTTLARVRAGNRGIGSSAAPPGENDRIAMEQAHAALEEIVSRVDGMFENGLRSYRDSLRSSDFTLLPEPPRLEVPR
jgi:hypothetical protein